MLPKHRWSAVSLREPWLLVVLCIVAAAQLAALWVVCLGQVRKAEQRHQNLVAEQKAVEQCVRGSSRGSLISCADRAADQRSAEASAARRNRPLAAAR